VNRRRALKVLGALAGVGLGGRYVLLPPSRSRKLEGSHELAVRIFESLDAESRKSACVPYDHPLRQYHNRGVAGGGVRIWDLDRDQRGMLTDLLYAGLSESGQERLPNEYIINFPGVHLMNLLICGDPKAPPYQLILTGPHLNLRIGGKSREGVAFGGPLVYGDQRGDGRQGLPGNLYRYQFEIAQRLFESLGSEQQRSAVQQVSPIQTQIELRGSEGSFPGVSIATTSPESKRIARELIDGILVNFSSEDVAYAWECLESNGGIDGLYVSYYREGEVDGSGQYQIFRLEGPAAVFYFRGYPHVHAFINVGMDGDAPLSVGELVGENPAVLEGERVKALFEAAMREQLGTDLAYYDPERVVGRLRAGAIREGDIYNMESWQSSVALVELEGANLPRSWVDAMRKTGGDPDPARVYSIATIGSVADDLNGVESRRDGIMLRDATIAYLKKHGFSRVPT
jgi:hypothetical protein